MAIQRVASCESAGLASSVPPPKWHKQRLMLGHVALAGSSISDGAKAQEGVAPAVANGPLSRTKPLPPSLAMRLIDDFLFVMPSRTAAQALAARLREGDSTACIVMERPSCLHHSVQGSEPKS